MISRLFAKSIRYHAVEILTAILGSKLPVQSNISELQISRALRTMSASKLLTNQECTMKSGARENSQAFNTVRDELRRDISLDDYSRAIEDLNSLQSNTQTVALAKYRDPKKILPLFETQLKLAGLNLDDLDRLKVIHVAGTKGKGSTCAFVESILRTSGLKTGFYNSPHLVKVTERIKINGQPIDDGKFSHYFRQVFDRIREGAMRENVSMPTYFSFLTILAFHIFIEEQVDCAIIEVGIGGEYDPTNVIRRPIVCGVTTLDYEHTNILGNKIESIAWTKAGISKPGAPLFTIEQDPPVALDVLKGRAKEKSCPFYICKPIDNKGALRLGIQGSAQYRNAALACHLADYFLSTVREGYQSNQRRPTELLETDIENFPRSFRTSLEHCSWAGRCQIIRHPGVTFFLDGAHTKKSMENCIDWFSRESDSLDQCARKFLMVNIIGDRNKLEILRPLIGYEAFEVALFCSNRINSSKDNPSSQTFQKQQSIGGDKSLENVEINAGMWKKLLEEHPNNRCNTIVHDSTTQVLDHIHRMLHGSVNCHVLVTGSLHFVGAVLETLPMFDKRWQ